MGDPAGENSRDLLEEASSIVELAKQVQDAVSSLASKSWNEEQILRKKALILDSDFHRIQSGIEKEIRLRRISHKDAERLEDELYKAKCIIDASEVSFLLPPKAHGTFMKMFLGSIDVRINRKDVRMKVKEEYNTYKDRTAFLFILFPSTLLLLRSWVWNGCLPTLPVQLYQAWLLFLYTSLALRENILRVNGSDIRPWWIYHHYCAMLMSVISLTWEIKGEPDYGHKQQAVQLFLAWTIMQGVSMLLQNRYQRQRLYTRIALGKAKRMDVVWGETAGVEGQLLLLCPILFILQGFEAFIGLLLLKTPPSAFRSEWQVVVCGVLLVLMAVGNFTNTVQTLVVKSRFKAKMKKSRANKM